MDTGLPFVDEHRTTIDAPAQVVWDGLRAYVDHTLAAGRSSVLTRLLGTRPASGFEVTEAVPRQRLVLGGRHRFSVYALAFELAPSGGHTELRARTHAAFPGPQGRVYRLLVIDSRMHVLATRHLLASIRRSCLAQV